MNARMLEPEWLDALPPHDRRALRSRRDLRRINALMRNPALISRALARHLPVRRGLRIAELGAGDGTVMLSAVRRLQWPQPEVTLVDRAPAVDLEAFSRLGCKATVAGCDVFAFFGAEHFDAIVANLFLHHFDDQRLQRLLALAAARTSLVIACEPRRSMTALAGSRLLGLIGCNDVTRHDALISVRAGFRDQEISSLWNTPGWTLAEQPAWPFSHLFIALRDAGA